jgi:hypothetical protein
VRIQRLSKPALFIIGSIMLLLGSTSYSKNLEQAKGFKIKAYMLQMATQSIPLKVIKKQVEIVADAGYNTIILQLCSTHRGSYQVTGPGEVKLRRCTKQQMMDLITYIRSLNLKVVIGVRAFTKSKGFCSGLAKKYPGIMTNPKTKTSFDKCLNPFYKFPDGRTAMEAVQLPVIDFAISLCGDKKPDFILLANDEGTADSIHQLASKHGTTAPELYAWFLNTCSDYVIKKGITPIMWGDMFLSKRLGKPGHGVIGFDHDSRLLKAKGCFNAEFLSKKHSILTSMNYLKNKDKIIIADWHYSPRPGGEFPTVDYFQKMGFKSVWGVTWYKDENIAQFSRYAYKKGCGGMLSCSFHTAVNNNVRYLYPITVYNAVCYYNNPLYVPPKVKSWHIETQNGVPVFNGKSTAFIQLQKPQGEFLFIATMPDSVKNASGYLELINSQEKLACLKAPFRYNKQKHEVTATFSLPLKKHSLPSYYSVRYNIILDKPKYIIQKTFQDAIIVSNKPAVTLADTKPGAQLNLDFSAVSKHDMKNRVFKPSGTYSSYFYVDVTSKKAKPEAGVLNCSWANKSFIFPADGFWDDLMKSGTKMTLEFKLDKFAKRKGFTSIVSYGEYHGGILVMLDGKNNLTVQLRNKTEGILRIKLPRVSLGKWYTLKLMLSKPDSKEKRTLKIYLNGKQKKNIVLRSKPGKPPFNFITIGCSVGRPRENIANLGKSRFYGSIRKISYEPLN